MLSQIQTSYQRVQQSLQRLTDSIAAYNPSTIAADELVAADDTLSEDLRTLHHHQSNVHRITDLKRRAETNDEKIKTHFRAVAQLRKDLTSIPTIESNTSSREDISVDDLLAYARYISPTTVPPTFRPRRDAHSYMKGVEEGKGEDGQMRNGVTTPPPPPPATATATAQDHTNPETTATATATTVTPHIKESTISLQTLTDPEKQWLNPTATLDFTPWPSHILIGNGALGSIQKMVESGKDPASVLSAEEQAEVDKVRKEEEEKERKEEEERARRRAVMFDAAGSAGGGLGRGRREAEDDVFDPDA
ncbi:hypothetical protein LTR78_010795 [Recurvomyces mirabilis]|uniref:Mediator of RNA polymerase II transcription subunit 4 n=1 Tax=Recurvomyces mirabilis TaxID=574656 RepID=A0AAE0TPT9_9PEZI|nr:hypothetical protein LTR78_010795 [Recurvomyces mirabilis]KAK5149507.1 hypothetical protein LTS14_010873 [Recurvomyces mirabilis]